MDQLTKTTDLAEAVAIDIAQLEKSDHDNLKKAHIATAHDLYLQITGTARVTNNASASVPVLLRTPHLF